MTTVTVLIPNPGSRAAAWIDPGSGVVAQDWPAAPAPDDRVVCYFEGNRFGAVNLTRWADRILHAADRMITKYPTIAMGAFPADQMTPVAEFDTETGDLHWLPGHSPDSVIVTGWLDGPLVTDDLLVSGAHFEARRDMATLRAGTPEQQMQAQFLSTHGPRPYKGL